MFSRTRALNFLVVTGLLFLMSGTRILCDIGSSITSDQCCSGVEENGHEKTSLQDAGSNQGSSHHDESAPERAPADSKSGPCCSNWYVFTAESANSSLATSFVSQILPSATGLPVHNQPITNPVNETIERFVSAANNRAPSSPLYLSIHSFRI
jgi:hypothetical protein